MLLGDPDTCGYTLVGLHTSEDYTLLGFVCIHTSRVTHVDTHWWGYTLLRIDLWHREIWPLNFAFMILKH